MPVAGPVWTAEEDDMLRRLVAQHGTKKWAHLATIIKSKKSKQCRRRWKNFQDAELKKTGVWTPAEDALLMEGHSKYGNKWTEIAKMVGGRTDNAVKNRWASLTKKNPRLADGSPSSAPSASADSSFSGSMPSQSRSAQSNSISALPTRMPGTRPSRLRSLTQAGDAEPNRMSTSNSDTRMRFQGSPESAPSVMAHPNLRALTVRTRVKSEPSSDGSGSARTPGSVNIRVWKDSLTPKEVNAAQEVNALGLPVHIQLEDQLIPLPQTYMASGAEAGDVKPDMAETNLWRTDTDGDLARWLTTGFTPRAAATFGEEQPLAFPSNTPRTQSIINNQQRQLLHKLFSKGNLASQHQVPSDLGQQQQGMYFQQQPQEGFSDPLQQPQQFMPMQQSLQQPQQYTSTSGQDMQGLKPGRSDQQAAYHINAQAYDSFNYGQPQFSGNQGQQQQAQQYGMLTRGQSAAAAQHGALTRGNTFDSRQFADQAMAGLVESPRLEVLVTPAFSSQELNMLLEALGDDEMVDMGDDPTKSQLQHPSSFGVLL